MPRRKHSVCFTKTCLLITLGEVGVVVYCTDHKGKVQPRTSHESLDGE